MERGLDISKIPMDNLLRQMMPESGCFSPTGEEISDEAFKRIWSRFYEKEWPPFTHVHHSCLIPTCASIKHRYPASSNGRFELYTNLLETMTIDDAFKSVSEMSDGEVDTLLMQHRRARAEMRERNKMRRAVTSDRAVKDFKKVPKNVGKEIRKKISAEDLKSLAAEFGMDL